MIKQLQIKSKADNLELEKTNCRKSSLKYALALAWLLSFSNVQADIETNLILNPAYSALPWNVLYNVIHSNNNLYKNPEFKETFDISLSILKKYIHSYKENIKQINREYLKLFTKIHKDENYSAWKSVEDFIELSSKQWLNYDQSMNLFLEYYNNYFFPKNFSKKFAKDFEYRLWEYLWVYDKKEFEKRFKKVTKLYNNWKLTRQNIKLIFPEIEKQKEKTKLLIILWIVISVSILFIYIARENRYENI